VNPEVPKKDAEMLQLVVPQATLFTNMTARDGDGKQMCTGKSLEAKLDTAVLHYETIDTIQ